LNKVSDNPVYFVLSTYNTRMKFATKAVHAGVHPDPLTGAVMTPIYQTSTYAQVSPGVHKGYEYSRTHNPTRTQLQDQLAALEEGMHGLCFSSGMAAIDAIVKLLSPGDEVIASNDLYGGTYRLFSKVYTNYGITFHYVDMSDPELVKAKVNKNTKLIYTETPTNPMLSVSDIAAMAAIAHSAGALLAVDNTFATPYLQKPITLGADIVIHSLTKYMGGHSDVVMGALIVKDTELKDRLAFIQNSCGATPGPQDCFLVLRGIKTLHLRMERHCHNARIIADWLMNHPKVAHVYYLGLPHHPGHAIAASQMKDFGGMISFLLKGDDYAEAIKVMESFKLFTLAESLGGVESLVTHPASMTHAAVPAAERIKSGLTDTLIRLSVGVEDVDDLIEDLAQAIG
jgi:cystathionine beta-lyase